MPLRQDKHVFALDGLRGVAILSVMGFHITDLPRGVFLGVDIFFALSGYLITSLLMNERDRYGNISLSRFYMRRILRLSPALFIAVLGVVLLDWVKPTFTPAGLRLECLDALFYFSNWISALGISSMGPLAHTWSLAIEEQYYLLWPVILIGPARLFPGRRMLALVVTGLAVAVTIHRLNMMADGAALVRLYNDKPITDGSCRPARSPLFF